MPLRHSKKNTQWTIIPPYILESIALRGTPAQRARAQQTLVLDNQIRAQRVTQANLRSVGVQGVGAPHKNRLIHTTANSTSLPGTLTRSEGQGASGDIAVNEAYDGLGATFDLFYDVYGRNSIDDNGQNLLATVHYGNQYNNAFWDGTQMVFGDGDGTIFNRFTIAIDIMGHELAHGVTEATAGSRIPRSAWCAERVVVGCFWLAGQATVPRSGSGSSRLVDWSRFVGTRHQRRGPALDEGTGYRLR